MGFDQNWYTNQYVDVAESRILPEAHYLEYGLFEGRYPEEPEWFRTLLEQKSWFIQELEIAQENYLISFESDRTRLKGNIYLKYYFDVEHLQKVLSKIRVTKDEQKKYVKIIDLRIKKIKVKPRAFNVKIVKKIITVIITNSDFDRVRILNIVKLNNYTII